jgi:RNA polymerase sigma factor (sigma-70 family)
MARGLPPALARILGKLSAGLRRDAAAGPALLARFAATRDEDAFAELVRLYGPLVWGVCQRCLHDPNDAEDALQATFVVLARKASGIAHPERLSAWLHGVALRAARSVRQRVARRREQPLPALLSSPGEAVILEPGLREALDAEVNRLPDKLRQAFVLCRIEGRTYVEAAELLGCQFQTVARWVTRATEQLRQRLRRRGLAPIGASPGLLPLTTVDVSFAVLDRAASGALSGPSAMAITVADSVIRSMSNVSLWRYLTLGILVFAGVGGVLIAAQGPAPRTVSRHASAVPVAPIPVDPLPEGAVGRVKTGREGPVAVALSPDNRIIYTVDGGDKIRVWDVATGKALRVITGPENCRWVTVPIDGRRLVAGGAEGVWFWALESDASRVLGQFSLPKGASIRCEAVAPNGHTLFLTGQDFDTFLRLPDLSHEAIQKFSDEWSRKVTELEDRQKNRAGRPPGDRVQAVFAADGGAVCRVETRGFLTMLSVSDPQTTKRLGALTLFGVDSYPTIAVAPGGRLVACAVEMPEVPGQEKKQLLRVNDRRNGAHLWTVVLPKGPIRSVVFSPDGRSLAVGCSDGTARVFEVFSGQERFRRNGHRGPVLCVVFSSDGQRLTSSGADGNVVVWNIRPNDIPSAEKPEELWTALEGEDGPAAYRAIHALVDRPGVAVPLLRARITPAAEGKSWRGMLRGVEALERMAGDAEARKLLVELAATPAENRLGLEAQNALRRLDGKVITVP